MTCAICMLGNLSTLRPAAAPNIMANPVTTATTTPVERSQKLLEIQLREIRGHVSQTAGIAIRAPPAMCQTTMAEIVGDMRSGANRNSPNPVNPTDHARSPTVRRTILPPSAGRGAGVSERVWEAGLGGDTAYAHL